MKTITQVRAAFWEEHPQFKPEFRVKKRQNDYNATIRTYFCDWLDSIHRDGRINESLANRATL